MHWTSSYLFVADDPAKAFDAGGGPVESQVLAMIGPMLEDAKQRISIISPYFVPGKQGSIFFVSQVGAGTEVRVLTNSLAANDVAMVYGGYSKSRPALLKGGVQIWELKPLPGVQAQRSMFGSSGASLHTKALAADSSRLFVGSYNLDPRSTSLNCEQGVFVEEPTSRDQLERFSTRNRLVSVRGPSRSRMASALERRQAHTTIHPKPRAGRIRPGWRRCCRWMRNSRSAPRTKRTAETSPANR
jgi:putative cardiolipin synthase